MQPSSTDELVSIGASIEDQDGAFTTGTTKANLIGNVFEEFGATPIMGSDKNCVVP